MIPRSGLNREEREVMVAAVVKCLDNLARMTPNSPHGLRSLTLGQLADRFSPTQDGAPGVFFSLPRQRKYRLIQNAVRAAVRRGLIRCDRGPWHGARYSLVSQPPPTVGERRKR